MRSKKLLKVMYARDLNGLKSLCDSDPDMVNVPITSYGGTALHMACQSGFLEAVEYLISIGVSPMQPSGILGGAPLLCAARSGNYQILDLIWRSGDCSRALSKECRPLFAALTGGDKDIINFFIDHGVDPRWEYADSPKTGEEWCLMNGKHDLLDVLFTDRNISIISKHFESLFGKPNHVGDCNIAGDSQVALNMYEDGGKFCLIPNLCVKHKDDCHYFSIFSKSDLSNSASIYAPAVSRAIDVFKAAHKGLLDLLAKDPDARKLLVEMPSSGTQSSWFLMLKNLCMDNVEIKGETISLWSLYGLSDEESKLSDDTGSIDLILGHWEAFGRSQESYWNVKK